jgi:hypothetical protein
LLLRLCKVLSLDALLLRSSLMALGWEVQMLSCSEALLLPLAACETAAKLVSPSKFEQNRVCPQF